MGNPSAAGETLQQISAVLQGFKDNEPLHPIQWDDNPHLYQGLGRTLETVQGPHHCVARIGEKGDVELAFFSDKPDEPQGESGLVAEVGLVSLRERHAGIEVDTSIPRDKIAVAGVLGGWLVEACTAARQKTNQNAEAKRKAEDTLHSDMDKLRQYIKAERQEGVDWAQHGFNAQMLTLSALQSAANYHELNKSIVVPHQSADLQGIYNFVSNPGGFFFFTRFVAYRTGPYDRLGSKFPRSS